MDSAKVQDALVTLRTKTRNQGKVDAVATLERVLMEQADALEPLTSLHPDAVKKAIPVLKALGLVAKPGSELEAFGALGTALEAILRLWNDTSNQTVQEVAA